MRKSVITLLLACVAMPVLAQQETKKPIYEQPGAICQECDPGDDGDGGGGGTPPPPPPSETRISYAEVNPTQGTVEIRLNTGAVFVIDDRLNKMFLGSPAHSAELNLDATVLQWADGDTARANLMRARIHNMVSNNIRANKLVPGAPTQGVMMGMPGGNSWGCYFTIYYCGVNGFSNFPDGGGGGWGNYSYAHYAQAGSGGHGSNDYRMWERFRDQACGAQRSGGRMMVIGTMAMIGACPFFETGLGAIGCGAAALSIIDGYDNFSENAQMCNGPYPGPGNW